MVVLLNLLCDHVLDELCFILSRLVVKIRRAVLTADLALDPQGVIEGIVTTVHVQPCVIIRSGVDVELLVHIEPRFDIFVNFSATLLLSSTLPVSSTFTYMAACGAEGVTRILNSSSVMFFKSNIVFIPFFILEQKFCIPTERSLAAMQQHFQVLPNPP